MNLFYNFYVDKYSKILKYLIFISKILFCLIFTIGFSLITVLSVSFAMHIWPMWLYTFACMVGTIGVWVIFFRDLKVPVIRLLVALIGACGVFLPLFMLIGIVTTD